MAVFPIFQLPAESTKIRFKEPYVSEGMNLKDAGIVPTGIFRGYTPNARENYQLYINTDPDSNDSVAVVETPPALSSARFNLTVRTTLQVVLDFSGHDFGASGPLYVVIRTQYSISQSPLVGITDAKILAVKTTLNNADPQSLHDGDIKICKVIDTSGVGNTPVISTVVPDDRDDNFGPLLTRRGILRILGTAEYNGPDIASGTPAPIPTTPPTINFTLPDSRIVIVMGSARMLMGVEDGDAQLYYKLDDVDQIGVVAGGFDLAHGGELTSIRTGNSFIRFHSLDAGVHTVQPMGFAIGNVRIGSPVTFVVIG